MDVADLFPPLPGQSESGCSRCCAVEDKVSKSFTVRVQKYGAVSGRLRLHCMGYCVGYCIEGQERDIQLQIDVYMDDGKTDRWIYMYEAQL